MSNLCIMNGTNIDTSVFMYSQLKANPKGPGKFVNLLNRMNRESIRISTPLMMTWGAQEGKDNNGQPNGKYTMSMQFPTPEYSTPEQEEFLKSMIALEEAVKEAAIQNSVAWFGKQVKEIDDGRMNPMIVYPKIKGTETRDYTRPPTFKIKIPQWNGVWKPEIYNESAEPLYIHGKVNAHQTPLEYLPKGTHLMTLIECGGIWFANSKLSITWNLKQAIVKAPKQAIEGSCFISITPDQQSKLNALPAPESNVDFDAPTTLVDDDDDDEDAAEAYARAAAATAAATASTATAAAVPAAVPAAAPAAVVAPAEEQTAPPAAIAVAPKVVKRVVKKTA